MKAHFFLAGLLALAAPSAAAAGDGWRLVWSDEFDGEAIDRSKWGFEMDCWGGGNEERQCYTASPRNAAVEGGTLSIMARREKASGRPVPLAQKAAEGETLEPVTRDFTSARLTTKGKASWTYGKIEVRAKLPGGQGTWPAIWMLPEDNHYGGWAASGEIDIMEAVNLGVACKTCPKGFHDDILGTLHFGGEWPNNRHIGSSVPLPGALDDFHVFGIIWEKGHFTWTIDGKPYATKSAADWSSAENPSAAPFDRPFHLILNLAIGGRLAEERGARGVDTSGFPKAMEIDWVRVWQPESAGARTGGSLKAGE